MRAIRDLRNQSLQMIGQDGDRQRERFKRTPFHSSHCMPQKEKKLRTELSLLNEELAVEIENSDVVSARWRHAENLMGYGIFEDVYAVVFFCAAIQKSDPFAALLFARPLIGFLAVTMPAREIEIFVTLQVVPFFAWIKMIDIHRPQSASLIFVDHRIGAPIFKVCEQRRQSLFSVVR